MDPDFYEKVKRIKRERFRDEIRKPQIEETLNSKRLSHKFSFIDPSLPIPEVTSIMIFGLKIKELIYHIKHIFHIY